MLKLQFFPIGIILPLLHIADKFKNILQHIFCLDCSDFEFQCDIFGSAFQKRLHLYASVDIILQKRQRCLDGLTLQKLLYKRGGFLRAHPGLRFLPETSAPAACLRPPLGLLLPTGQNFQHILFHRHIIRLQIIAQPFSCLPFGSHIIRNRRLPFLIIFILKKNRNTMLAKAGIAVKGRTLAIALRHIVSQLIIYKLHIIAF